MSGAPEVDIDGILDEKRNVRYVGKAVRQRDGKYLALASVDGCLCRVLVNISIRVKSVDEPGEWRCRCQRDPAHDTSVNPRFVKACAKCGEERPEAVSADIALMRHALGISRRGGKWTEAYRNGFCANPGDDDDTAWKGLVERGLARLSVGPNGFQSFNVYAVTDAGKEIAKP